MCIFATLPSLALAQEPYQAPPAEQYPPQYQQAQYPQGQYQQPYQQPYQQYPGYPNPYQGYPPPRLPGYHTHDGFFLRTHIGLGYMRMSDDSGYDAVIKGMTGSFGLALGGALTENLVVFGELMDDIISDPSVTRGGVDYGTASGSSAGVIAMGVGLAYYVIPANMYISGTLAATWLQSSNGSGDSYTSDAGMGVNLMVGKEWWVSHDWGVGIAGQALYSRNKDEAGVNWTSTAFTLAFSASYN